jgi:hypothetical protein
MAEVVAYRYRWKDALTWVHSTTEPNRHPNLIVEPLCVASKTSEFKPFSTYPEDRETLLKLAATVENSYSDSNEFIDAADSLADLVRAILTDEAVLVEAGA